MSISSIRVLSSEENDIVVGIGLAQLISLSRCALHGRRQDRQTVYAHRSAEDRI